MKPMPAPTPIRTTKSICPVCYRIIDAKLYEENGAVYMEKSCAEHGTFKDLCWSDYRLYKQFEAKGIEEARETLLFVRMYDMIH
jgi:uncharacterized radical SAM superfamily Fe-S cluster-containing enzyme